MIVKRRGKKGLDCLKNDGEMGREERRNEVGRKGGIGTAYNG